jgi:ubiquinone/menaquinone biosynthesis C-methylase UbiE
LTVSPPASLHPKSTARSGSDQEALYGSSYFDEQLHRQHWFHNNAAKRELRWQEVVRMLKPDARDRILEIGCATGEHSLRLAQLVREVVGVDLAETAIARGRERAEAARTGNVRFVVLDAAHLSGIEDATFDKVAAIDFVEHIDDATLLSVLRETKRVLRPRGLLAIFTPCASHYVERMKLRDFVLHQTPGHIGVRDERQYRHLLPQAGFDIESLYFSPSTYPFAGSLDRWLWKTPLIGPLFRFRLCIVAVPANIASQK